MAKTETLSVASLVPGGGDVETPTTVKITHPPIANSTSALRVVEGPTIGDAGEILPDDGGDGVEVGAGETILEVAEETEGDEDGDGGLTDTDLRYRVETDENGRILDIQPSDGGLEKEEEGSAGVVEEAREGTIIDLEVIDGGETGLEEEHDILHSATTVLNSTGTSKDLVY